MLGCTYLSCSLAHRFTANFRRRWASFSAGVSLAYVFVDVFPELAAGTKVIASTIGEGQFASEERVYVIALLGLMVFKSLAHIRNLAEHGQDSGDEAATPWFLYIHAGALGLYNASIGYLLVGRAHAGMSSLVLYVFAMALHAILIDEELAHQYGGRYGSAGRIWLAASVLAGWAASSNHILSEVAFTRLFAFLAGGIIMTSMRPKTSQGDQRLGWLVSGTAIYTLVLLII